tara:strand:- start:94 stop:345 length:252 start_codon:yes stop_codon:yes gene_type:complete
MMAITIRDTSEHDEMLSKLKEQTNTSTMSKALINGGYDALRYYKWYHDLLEENEKLKDQLYERNQAIGDFVDALDNLRTSVDK